VDLRGRQLADDCDQGNVEALLPYEQRLMQDFSDGKSFFGRVCFDTTQGAKDSEAQALFILGMKSFSNFGFDLCKHTFNKLIRKKPDFAFGYWGRSFCNAQLVWNYEEPVASAKLLESGRKQLESLTGTYQLSDKEEAYYSAAEALNSYAAHHEDCPLNNVDPSSNAGVLITRPCRYLAFLKEMQDLAEAYPDDPNAGAFAILGNIAAAAVKCKNEPPSSCLYLNKARALAHHLAFESGSKNPAVLHFGLHAHDYPEGPLYEGGLPYAEAYPQYVNGSCHSVHMPSHLWDRAGIFDMAEASNAASVRAADGFADSGALAYDGGDFGSMDWTPQEPGWISGIGFAGDAGNLYHSLEYQQYEYLQMCNFDHARRLTDRMATAALQAFAAVGPAGNFGDSSKFGEAWRDSTTYWQFLYRMEARFSHFALSFKLLGGVGAGVPDTGAIGFRLPLPLSWSGMDVYSHEFYSPQSEAGVWSAIALDRLLQFLGAARPSPRASPDEKQIWMMGCSDEPLGKMVDCIDSIVGMAVKRISMVQQKYLEDQIGYESNLTSSVLAQVHSAASLVAGDAQGALKFAEQSRDDEKRAQSFFLPTSSSLYFIPGYLWHGMICLRLLEADAPPAPRPKETMELLKEAQASFAYCLSPAGRPNHTACLLGAARVEDHLWKLEGHSGRSPKAANFYKTLLVVWGGANRRVVSDPPASDTCSEAWNEAAGGHASGGRGQSPVVITECGEGTELVGSACTVVQSGALAYLKMLVIALIGAAVGAAVGWYLRAQRSRGRAGCSRLDEVEVRSYSSSANGA